MNVRAIRQNELPPEARIDAAKRRLADAIVELVDAHVAKVTARSEWISQDDSPLGRERHLRLIRDNILPAAKDGRKRLVRKSDIDAYLAKRPILVKVDKPKSVSAQELQEMLDVGGIK